jgi:hypothetical protein
MKRTSEGLPPTILVDLVYEQRTTAHGSVFPGGTFPDPGAFEVASRLQEKDLRP